MNTNNKIQHDHAYDIYFNANYNVEEMSKMVGVNSRTLYRWIKKGNWRQIKENAVRMPASIVEDMYSQLIAINYIIKQRPPMERFPSKEESEIQRRLITSIRHIKQQATTGETTQVMTNFISWLLPLNHDMAVEMTNYVTTYINSRGEGSISPQQVEYFNRTMKEEYKKEDNFSEQDDAGDTEIDIQTDKSLTTIDTNATTADTSGLHIVRTQAADNQTPVEKKWDDFVKKIFSFPRPPLTDASHRKQLVQEIIKKWRNQKPDK